MVVNKLIFLILSVISINLNLIAVNNASDVANVDQYGSKIRLHDKQFEESHAKHKRSKREDDTAQGNDHFINIENKTVKTAEISLPAVAKTLSNPSTTKLRKDFVCESSLSILQCILRKKNLNFVV